MPEAEALEPLSHILPCWHDTMQVSAPPVKHLDNAVPSTRLLWSMRALPSN